MRALTIRNIYDKKYSTLTLDGIYAEVFGEPEDNGAWLIYGLDKNGKTWLSLLLAEYLSHGNKALYVSAEQGIEKDFGDTCKRIGISEKNKTLHVLGYIPIEELDMRLKKRKAEKLVFVDNLTTYEDELKKSRINKLLRDHSEKLFIFLAHEERNKPYLAAAIHVHKIAKIIMHVKGLQCTVSGRCPGGVLTIDEEKAQLYWGYNK